MTAHSKERTVLDFYVLGDLTVKQMEMQAISSILSYGIYKFTAIEKLPFSIGAEHGTKRIGLDLHRIVPASSPRPRPEVAIQNTAPLMFLLVVAVGKPSSPALFPVDDDAHR